MIENVKIYKGNCLEVIDKLIDEGIKVDARQSAMIRRESHR